MSQTSSTSSVYTLIEEWWGEPLTAELVDRMMQSPLEHLVAFRDHYYSAYRPEMPAVRPTRIRPFTGSLPAGSFALDVEDRTWPNPHPITRHLLLYSHDIVIEEPLSFILWRIDAWAPSLGWALRPAFRMLMEWRPAVEAGATRLVPRFKNPYEFDETTKRLLALHLSVLRLRDRPVFGPDEPPADPDELERMAWMLTTCSQWNGFMDPLCVSSRELLLLEAAISAGARTNDVSGVRLRRLAEVAVPLLDISVVEACKVRQDPDWGEWRAALTRALAQIDQLRDDEHWQPLAREALRDELTPIRDRMMKDLGKSPALTAMQKSVGRMAISGLGAGAGLQAGAAVGPTLAALGATALGTLGDDYIRALRKKKNSGGPMLSAVLALSGE